MLYSTWTLSSTCKSIFLLSSFGIAYTIYWITKNYFFAIGWASVLYLLTPWWLSVSSFCGMWFSIHSNYSSIAYLAMYYRIGFNTATKRLKWTPWNGPAKSTRNLECHGNGYLQSRRLGKLSFLPSSIVGTLYYKSNISNDSVSLIHSISQSLNSFTSSGILAIVLCGMFVLLEDNTSPWVLFGIGIRYPFWSRSRH